MQVEKGEFVIGQACPKGHKRLMVYRIVGQIIYLRCMERVYDERVRGFRWCGLTETIHPGPKGFLVREGLGENQTKARVLGTLSWAPVEGWTIPELCEKLPDLTKGQIDGVLARTVKGGWVQKSQEKVFTACSRAYTYRLAHRGWVWLKWALKEKLVYQEDQE